MFLWSYEKKRKGKYTLFSDHKGSLLRRQPAAWSYDVSCVKVLCCKHPPDERLMGTGGMLGCPFSCFSLIGPAQQQPCLTHLHTQHNHISPHLTAPHHMLPYLTSLPLPVLTKQLLKAAMAVHCERLGTLVKLVRKICPKLT